MIMIVSLLFFQKETGNYGKVLDFQRARSENYSCLCVGIPPFRLVDRIMVHEGRDDFTVTVVFRRELPGSIMSFENESLEPPGLHAMTLIV